MRKVVDAFERVCITSIGLVPTSDYADVSTASALCTSSSAPSLFTSLEVADAEALLDARAAHAVQELTTLEMGAALGVGTGLALLIWLLLKLLFLLFL